MSLIEAVARRAKAGKPTIYRWWPSKAALLLDVYHRQKGETFYPDTGNTRGDLTAFLETLLGFWKKSGGEVFRSIIAEAQSDPAALEALRERQAELQQADIRKNEFLAMLAHELRNPLTPISLIAERMVRLPSDQLPRMRELIGVIDRPVDQVLIESRIVIATDTFARELGAKFGVSGSRDNVFFNNTVGNNDTNNEMTKRLAKWLKRPLLLPNIPAFVLRLILGERAVLVLSDLRASNQKIKQAGFSFKYTALDSVFKSFFKKR